VDRLAAKAIDLQDAGEVARMGFRPLALAVGSIHISSRSSADSNASSASHCDVRKPPKTSGHAQQSSSGLIPAGGKLGVTSPPVQNPLASRAANTEEL